MLNCTTNLKAAAVSSQGNIPTAKVEVYDVLGTISTSKGLECKIYDGFTVGPDGKQLWPVTGKSYCPLVAFNWGDSPPLGITKDMLADSKSWSMTLRGYFHATMPEDYTGAIAYQFGFVSTSYTVLSFTGIGEGGFDQVTAIDGTSPNAIKTTPHYYAKGDTWLPIQIGLRGAGSGTSKHRDEEKLIVYWRTFQDVLKNGSFKDDLSGWNVSGGGWLWGSGKAVYFPMEWGVGVLSATSVAITPGHTYLVNYDIVGGSAGTIQCSCGGASGGVHVPGSSTYTESFLATTSAPLSFTPSIDFDGAIDNVKIFRLEDDSQWRILGADVTCPLGGKYNNLVGNAVSGVDSDGVTTRDARYVLTFHVSGSDYHMHIDDSTIEKSVEPGQTMYNFSLESNLYGTTIVDLTLNDTIEDNDTTEIFSVRGEEEPYILDVTNVDLSMSKDSASTLTFDTPITLEEYDADSKTMYNATTYDIHTQGFGVIRKNAYVTCSLGYQISNSPENIKRFSGFIQDIEPSHSVDENGSPSMMLRVTCMDARVKATTAPPSKIGEMMIGNLPNKFTYNLAEYFVGNATDIGPDTIVMPQCFDKWNLAKVARTVLYCNGYQSSQLWAKDSNGNLLLEDRGIYLDYTMAYPYTLVSSMGGRVDMGTINIPTMNPEVYYKGETAGVKTKQDEQTLWKTAADVKEFPYNYILDIGDNAWDWLQNICQSYGLDLYPDVDGNICLQSPTRTILYPTETAGEKAEEYFSVTSGTFGWDREVAPDAIANVVYTSSDKGAGMMIYFTGVGVKLILARTETIGRIRATIDGTVVDGETELDTDTGDKGHIDWVSQIQDPKGSNWVSIKLPYEVGKTTWYYSYWMHPEEGKNPCVYSICDNLTYGKHTCYVELLDGTVSVEGFISVKKSMETAQHTFDVDHVTNINSMDSVADIRNDIIVIGNTTGAGGDYIHARATDVAGIYNESSPTYIGEQRTGIIVDPKIVNQDRAEFLAKYLLTNYYKGIKRPTTQTIGLPWLTPRDPVGIRDIHDDHPVLGMLADSDITAEDISDLGYNVALAPFRVYWIENISERYSIAQNGDTEYSMSCNLTTEPPKPTFEPVPEPVLATGDPAIDEIDISIDGGTASYNPYQEHYASKYVNISFNLNWNAMVVVARVCPTVLVRTFTEEQFLPGQPVNVILSRQGFTPAGKYEIKWDGWIDLGGGKGTYAPNGTYYVEIETVRYNTKETFFVRTDNALADTMASGSNTTIIIQHNRGIYTSPLFNIGVTPAISSYSYYNPPVIYDDTNSNNGVQFDITLNCPAKLVMTMSVAHLYFTGSLPSDTGIKKFAGDRFEIQLIPDDSDILEPGTYTFYFRPKSMTVFNNALQAFNSVPRASKSPSATPVWVAWNYMLLSHVLCVDKAGKMGYANGNKINSHNSTSITVTGKNFTYMGIETGSVLRRKLESNVARWYYGVVTSVGTDTLTCSGGWHDRGVGSEDWDDSDNWEVGGVPIGGATGALVFPYGYNFCWGGPTSGTYTTALRHDCNRYYHFFKVIT